MINNVKSFIFYLSSSPTVECTERELSTVPMCALNKKLCCWSRLLLDTPLPLIMAEGSNHSNSQQDAVTVAETDIMNKRREYILQYKPPRWKSSQPDPVSGDVLEVSMTSRASIH